MLKIDAFNHLSMLDLNLLALDSVATPFAIEEVRFDVPINMEGDDYAGDTTTTGVLLLDGSVTANFDFSMDIDWFAITLGTDQAVSLTVDIDVLQFAIYDNSGALIARRANTNEYDFIADTADTYFVGLTGKTGQTGAYTLTSQGIVDDYSRDISTTGTLVLGGSSDGVFEIGRDTDWFSITLTANQVVEFSLSKLAAEFAVYDANGTIITPSSSTNKRYFVTSEDGTYFVSVKERPFRDGAYTLSAIDQTNNEIGEAKDYLYDASRGLLYISTDIGTIQRYDIETDSYLSQIVINGDLNGMTISADGSTLFAAQEDHRVINSEGHPNGHLFDVGVYEVDLNTLEITNHSYEVGGFDRGAFDVALASNGKLLVTSNNAGTSLMPLRALSGFDSELVIDVVANLTQSSNLYTTFDGQYILAPSPSDNSADLNIYSSSEEQIVASTNFGALNRGQSAISGEADLVAISGQDQLVVYNFNFELQADLTALLTDTLNTGTGFSADGYHLFTWTVSEDFIRVIDMTYFVEVGRIDMSARDTSAANGQITVSGDGQYVILNSTTEFDVIKLAEDMSLNISGNGNDEILNGSVGNDIIDGSGGDDIINGGAGMDILDGGAGIDILSYASSLIGQTFIMADVNLTNGNFEGDTFQNFEGLEGTGGDDINHGIVEDDLLFGGNGNDTIRAGAGHDLIEGGDGDDTILGNAGEDELSGGADNDLIIGGGDSDTINGDDGNDSLSGQGGDDFLYGGAGNDSILGGSGGDNISGEDGDDDINAGGGNDVLYGGDKVDTISGGSGADFIYGGFDNDIIFGNNQGDSLHGDEGDDIIDGGAGNDFIYGGDGADMLLGGASQDLIVGDAGNDTLFGNSGGDDLSGGDGDDTLDGGGGNDTLTGGLGADVYIQNSGFRTDRITDFEDGADLIDFSGNTTVNDFAKVMNSAFQQGTTVRIELNPNNILVLENFDLADLDAGDFIF